MNEEYGHAHRNLKATAKLANHSTSEGSYENDAKILVDQYGEAIVPFLKPELRDVAQRLINNKTKP